MRFKKQLLIAVILLLVAIINHYNPQTALPGPSPTPTTSPSIQPNSDLQMVKVTKVIDGDTIQIEGGQTLRYIGIDTPETVDPRKPVQCFGNEASRENSKIVEGQVVFLEKDVSETDKYGRLLRYVYISLSTGEMLMVNEYLVKEGYAVSSSYPPDIKYQERLRVAEESAKSQGKGLWGICKNIT